MTTIDPTTCADEVRFADGNGTSDYWRGFNDGIDRLISRLTEVSRDRYGFDFDAALGVYDVAGMAQLLHETSPDCRKIPVAAHEREMHARADRNWAEAVLANVWNREMDRRNDLA